MSNRTVIIPSWRTRIERLRVSRNGNPAWLIMPANGPSYRTSPDSMCAYSVQNHFENSRATGNVLLTLNSKGQVIGVEAAQ